MSSHVDNVAGDLPCNMELGEYGCSIIGKEFHNYTIPKVGMQFDKLDEVEKLWNGYGLGIIGFSVRIEYRNKSRKDKTTIINALYVCSKYGLPGEVKRWAKKSGCKACLNVVLDKETGKYRIKTFNGEHNHVLEPPQTRNMLTSRDKISSADAASIDIAHDAGLTPRATHELLARQAGGRDKLTYVMEDQKTYRRCKRGRNIDDFEFQSVLKYFKLQKSKDKLFDYSLQVEDRLLTSMFWADAGLVVDYEFFGDVVSFDTTFGTNKEMRSFGIFSGLNHHREIVIFGAALLYDETISLFKWVFEIFLRTHGDKKPRTIFTDQDAAIANAINSVFPETETHHGLCTYHIMQHAIKHLTCYLSGKPNILENVSRCMYGCDTEVEFEKEWKKLSEYGGVQENNWLNQTYLVRKKWAKCFMSNTLTLGIHSTQISESVNSDIKACLTRKLNMDDFFKHVDRIVDHKRYKEMRAESRARQHVPLLGNEESSVLQQVSLLYTPAIFKRFKTEFMLSSRVMIKNRNNSEAIHEYIVACIDEIDKEFTVLCNPNDGMVVANCLIPMGFCVLIL